MKEVDSGVFEIKVTDMQLWLVMRHIEKAVKAVKSEREKRELELAYRSMADAFVGTN